MRDAAGKVTPVAVNYSAGAQLRSRHRLPRRGHLGRNRQGIEPRDSSNTTGTSKTIKTEEQHTMNAFAEILETIAKRDQSNKRAMTNHGVLNEAYHYAKPSSFSRGMRIDLNGADDSDHLAARLRSTRTASAFISATLPAQLQRTFDNITGLLESEGATWKDIVQHQLLSARHRPRLRCLQPVAHGLLQGAGARPGARIDRHSGASLPA